jgi:predicted amidohydrolase YtcJ
VTHEYTILHGGTVIPGDGSSDGTAIAWAEGVVIAVGDDAGILGISRGDSAFVHLQGAAVAAADAGASLGIGDAADLVILSADPRRGVATEIALLRGGHVVRGALPGGSGR